MKAPSLAASTLWHTWWHYHNEPWISRRVRQTLERSKIGISQCVPAAIDTWDANELSPMKFAHVCRTAGTPLKRSETPTVPWELREEAFVDLGPLPPTQRSFSRLIFL